MGLMFNRRCVHFFAGIGLLMLAPAPGHAALFFINNGLAPPNPANVFTTVTGTFDIVAIRNAGCPPGFPDSGTFQDPCPSPGAPTTVELPPGGFAAFLQGFDSSQLVITGGEVVNVTVSDTSSLIVESGNFGLFGVGCCGALGNSTVRMEGGNFLTGPLDIQTTGTFEVVGTSFQIDGVDAPYGPVAQSLGVLTGILANDDPIDIAFQNPNASLVLSAPVSVPALHGVLLTLLAIGMAMTGLRALPASR
jgi:hypothetical protein